MHVINFHGSDSCLTDIKRSVSCISTVSSAGEFCRICHCERTESNDQTLIRPCLCSGTLMFVHQSCLQKWIKSSDIKKCELCQYKFVMEAKVKPFRKVCALHNYSSFVLLLRFSLVCQPVQPSTCLSRKYLISMEVHGFLFHTGCQNAVYWQYLLYFPCSSTKILSMLLVVDTTTFWLFISYFQSHINCQAR